MSLKFFSGWFRFLFCGFVYLEALSGPGLFDGVGAAWKFCHHTSGEQTWSGPRTDWCKPAEQEVEECYLLQSQSKKLLFLYKLIKKSMGNVCRWDTLRQMTTIRHIVWSSDYYILFLCSNTQSKSIQTQTWCIWSFVLLVPLFCSLSVDSLLLITCPGWETGFSAHQTASTLPAAELRQAKTTSFWKTWGARNATFKSAPNRSGNVTAHTFTHIGGCRHHHQLSLCSFISERVWRASMPDGEI